MAGGCCTGALGKLMNFMTVPGTVGQLSNVASELTWLMNISDIAHDLTSGRFQMFMNRSWGEHRWLNAPEMNAAVHRLMFIDLVFSAALSLVAPISDGPSPEGNGCWFSKIHALGSGWKSGRT